MKFSSRWVYTLKRSGRETEQSLDKAWGEQKNHTQEFTCGTSKDTRLSHSCCCSFTPFIWIPGSDGQITGDYKTQRVCFKKLDEAELYPANPLVFSEPRLKSITEMRYQAQAGPVTPLRSLPFLQAHLPLPFQIREPPQVVRYDVVIPAAGTLHYHHPVMVG